MVRFIIIKKILNAYMNKRIYIPIWLDLLLPCGRCLACQSQIYIPIWLDLLCLDIQSLVRVQPNLHSNMVRFIIYIIHPPICRGI